MQQLPKEQIEAIVRSLETKGIPAAPVMEATALATSHPESVSDLAIAVMKRFPKGGTFLDAALTYLPHEDWPALVHTHSMLSSLSINLPTGVSMPLVPSLLVPACSPPRRYTRI